MSNGPPWKTALIGAVAIAAGLALLFVDWKLAQLAAFVAMLFVARGALHIVTTSFVGVEGAVSALTGCGELAVGITALAWPSPTLLVLAVVVGVWVLVHGVVHATLVLASGGERPRRLTRILASVLEIALGVVLIARPGGTVRGAALALGLLALLEGVTEIAAAAGHKLSERRTPGPASVRPRAAAVS